MSPRALNELSPQQLRQALLATIARCLVIFALVVALFFVAPDRSASADANFVVRLIIALALFVVVIAWQVRRLMRADLPQLRAFEVVCFALALLLVIFAGIYTGVSASDPAAFSEPLSRLDAFYFAVVTFGTVGFGDISARTELARILVTFQVLLDLVFIALIVRVILQASRISVESATPQQ